MSDYMLLEYLRNQGMRENEHKLLNDFKQYMRSRKRGYRGVMRHKDYDYDDMEYGRHDWDMNYMDSYMAKGKMDSHVSENHFEEFEAKELVSEMYHHDGGRKHTGEHFDMRKATEVYNKFKDQMLVEATPEDVYVAINATYHDFCHLLKSWFGSNIDEKAILLAITFWFKDDDFQGNKLMHYFM